MEKREERRVHNRKDCQITVKLITDKREDLIENGITNISAHGLFVKTFAPLPIGTKLGVEFDIPEANKVISCKGKVMWGYKADPLRGGRDVPGMGIKTENLNQQDMSLISRFVNNSN
ncbi:MAG: response regulator CheY [bacterium]|nr:MAG: response regulator CheY [bacterium]